MTSPAGDLEVAERWERKRWADFKDNLTKVSRSNLFQKKHFFDLQSLNDWDCFADFIKACPFTEKLDWQKIAASILLLEPT